jgi:phage FluMu protein Com
MDQDMKATERHIIGEMATLYCPACRAKLCRFRGAIEIVCRRCKRLLHFETKVDKEKRLEYSSSHPT